MKGLKLRSYIYFFFAMLQVIWTDQQCSERKYIKIMISHYIWGWDVHCSADRGISSAIIIPYLTLQHTYDNIIFILYFVFSINTIKLFKIHKTNWTEAPARSAYQTPPLLSLLGTRTIRCALEIYINSKLN